MQKYYMGILCACAWWVLSWTINIRVSFHLKSMTQWHSRWYLCLTAPESGVWSWDLSVWIYCQFSLCSNILVSFHLHQKVWIHVWVSVMLCSRLVFCSGCMNSVPGILEFTTTLTRIKTVTKDKWMLQFMRCINLCKRSRVFLECVLEMFVCVSWNQWSCV